MPYSKPFYCSRVLTKLQAAIYFRRKVSKWRRPPMTTKWNDQISVAMQRWSGDPVPLAMPAYTRRSGLTVIQCSQCHDRLERGDDIVPCGGWSIL